MRANQEEPQSRARPSLNSGNTAKARTDRSQAYIRQRSLNSYRSLVASRRATFCRPGTCRREPPFLGKPSRTRSTMRLSLIARLVAGVLLVCAPAIARADLTITVDKAAQRMT